MFYKQEIYDILHAHGIRYKVTEHPAVFNMAQLSSVPLPYPEADAKNLFVRDDKRKNYYLLTVRGDQRVDLKAFRKTYGTRPLTFVPPDELSELLGLIPGAVSPFGLLNDEERKVAFYIDRSFLEGSGLVGVHPNDNTATVWLKTADLLSLLREHGSEVHTAAL